MNIKIKHRYLDEIFYGGEYSYVGNSKFRVVLDIGANLGSFSYWIYPKAEIIHAIEPFDDGVGEMVKIKENNNLDKLQIYQCAIYGKTGRYKFLKASENSISGAWRLRNIEDKKGIQAYSMKDFLDNNKIDKVDLMKIDVEGNECEIFTAKDFPSERIRKIIGEYHPPFKEIMLTDLGYKVKFINVKSSKHFIATK